MNRFSRRRQRIAVECLEHRQVVRFVADGENFRAVPAHDREQRAYALILADADGRDVEAAGVRVGVDLIAEPRVERGGAGVGFGGQREAHGELLDLLERADLGFLNVDDGIVPFLCLTLDPRAFRLVAKVRHVGR